jgi:hypothetical protein
MLVMLAGRYRDDIREALETEELPPAFQGREHRPLDELTSVELGSLSGAVVILLRDRFIGCMGDPAFAPMLREFAEAPLRSVARYPDTKGDVSLPDGRCRVIDTSAWGSLG